MVKIWKNKVNVDFGCPLKSFVKTDMITIVLTSLWLPLSRRRGREVPNTSLSHMDGSRIACFRLQVGGCRDCRPESAALA